MDSNGNVFNFYEVTTNRLQRIKAGQKVFSVWRGKTAYKDDVIKCFHVVYDNCLGIDRISKDKLTPLWIEKKNLKYLRELTFAEVDDLHRHNILQKDKADDIFIYGKFIKETEKAIFVRFANEIDVWVPKSMIINNKIYKLKDREDICFEYPRWMAKDKLGQEVSDKFANAKSVISQNIISIPITYSELGGANA